MEARAIFRDLARERGWPYGGERMRASRAEKYLRMLEIYDAADRGGEVIGVVEAQMRAGIVAGAEHPHPRDLAVWGLLEHPVMMPRMRKRARGRSVYRITGKGRGVLRQAGVTA